MVAAMTQLLLYQLAGEAIVRGLGLPVPGPVLGMFLLFLTLMVRGGPGGGLEDTSRGLLQHLSLLFVPAGTGIMVHIHRVAAEWLPILVSLIVSTAATLAVTALAMRFAIRRSRPAATGESR